MALHGNFLFPSTSLRACSRHECPTITPEALAAAVGMPVDYHGVFATSCTFEENMQWLESMRATQPAYAKQLLLQGQDLLSHAEEGSLRPIMSTVGRAKPQELLPYFTIRMFTAAACRGHTTLMRYMVVQGFDYTQRACRGLLQEVASASTVSAAAREASTRLLMKLGLSINRPVGSNGFAPLHCSVAMHDVPFTAALLKLGADPNSVANADVMPLSLAVAAAAPSAPNPIMAWKTPCTPPAGVKMAADTLDGARGHKLVSVLLSAGARLTWRSGSPQPSSQTRGPAAATLSSAPRLACRGVSTASGPRAGHAAAASGGAVSSAAIAVAPAALTHAVACAETQTVSPSEGMRSLAAEYLAKKSGTSAKAGAAASESVPQAPLTLGGEGDAMLMMSIPSTLQSGAEQEASCLRTEPADIAPAETQPHSSLVTAHADGSLTFSTD